MIKGMDVSKWNGKGNWDVAKAKGVEFAFIRLGSIDNITGKCYLDYLLQDHLAEAIRTNTPFGYYFYTRPIYSEQLQSDYIQENLKNLPKAKLEFAIDAEEIGASIQATTDFLAFLSYQLPIHNIPSLIYTRQTFWDSYVLPDPMWATLKLWAGRYNLTLTSPWSDGKYVFRDWKNWKFWQFTDKAVATEYGFPGGPVYSATLDLDYYNGTIEEFRAEYNILTPQQELENRVKELERKMDVAINLVHSIQELLGGVK